MDDAESEGKTIDLRDQEKWKGELKAVGGSKNDDFNHVVSLQAVHSAWYGNDDKEQQDRRMDAGIAGLVGIGPKDEIEGMMAAQMLAAHNAAMECFRRAMLPQQTFEGRKENLAQANKLTRSFAALSEALDRHRGKGQQKVTVEHVHVHAGGQAVVGAVSHPGGGGGSKPEEQPHALGYAPGTEMRSTDEERVPMPVAGDGQRPLPDARRGKSGGAKG